MSTPTRVPLPVMGRPDGLTHAPVPVTGEGPDDTTVEISGFLHDLVDQLRAGDTYGQFDRLTDLRLLAPFVLTREERRAIPVDGDVDPITESRLRTYFQAVSAGVEKATGLATSYVLDLSHEGFGRVVVFAGRLVALSEVLRDAHRFGFVSLEQLGERGDRFVQEAIVQIERHQEVARDDS